MKILKGSQVHGDGTLSMMLRDLVLTWDCLLSSAAGASYRLQAHRPTRFLADDPPKSLMSSKACFSKALLSHRAKLVQWRGTVRSVACMATLFLVAFLLLVAMPFAPSSFLLLVVRPGAPSSVWEP